MGESGSDKISVTFVSTPDDGSCGIGTYTGSLMRTMSTYNPEVEIRHVPVRLRSINLLHYAVAAVRAGTTESDVIHVQHEYGIYGPKSITSWIFFPLLYLLTTLRDIPVIITLHSAWNDETISPPLESLKRIYVRLNNEMLNLIANRLIFLSDNCKNRFQESVDLGPFVVLSHGVQNETRDITTDTAKHGFGFNPDDKVIVEPGYVREEKGQDLFVDIAEELPERSFLIAGGTQAQEDESFFEAVKQESPDNVQLTGVLDDERFHAAFNAADLIVLPYREVTQSGIFNWCAAYELPVLATNSEYFDRLREKWGCVELFDPKEPVEGAKKVEQILQDDNRRKRLSDAIGKYHDAHSMESITEHHVEIYAKASRTASRR